MPNLIAMSFEGDLAPSFDLKCLSPGRKLPDGWGIGYYPGGEPSASVLKEPAPPPGSIRSELVKAWEHLESSLFVLHIRKATWGSPSDANTQPFCRSRGGRDWLCVHGGSLRERLPPAEGQPYEPVGSTDTEAVFCRFLSHCAVKGWRSLDDAPPAELQSFFDGLNDHGGLSLVITDGRDLCVYVDRDDAGLFVWQPVPPDAEQAFGDQDLAIDLARRGVKGRKGVVFSASPLQPIDPTHPSIAWRALKGGALLLARQGAIRVELPPLVSKAGAAEDAKPARRSPLRRDRSTWAQAAEQKLSVYHRTTYRYDTPVEHSTHRFRLLPMHDRLQEVLSAEVEISVDGQRREYDDVFGNRVITTTLEQPYMELEILAKSTVLVRDLDPVTLRLPRARSSIPLVWMPWQRHMLQPYLVPPELSETELLELTDYAMSFVRRNDFDLLDTLLDLNATIFEEYAYQQGSTHLGTSAFDVYAGRRGVCQDFTNLFICLARLLGVPARYTCGYVYTHASHANTRQAEASHAWVQVYLPEIGWRGFDPTNGTLTQTDHVRVAVGRMYGDATPTSGTLFIGGGRETLDVLVRVDRVE